MDGMIDIVEVSNETTFKYKGDVYKHTYFSNGINGVEEIKCGDKVIYSSMNPHLTTSLGNEIHLTYLKKRNLWAGR